MFGLSHIHTSAKFDPAKDFETEIYSVELMAEFAEVQLKELGFYVMIRIQYASLGVADGNVYPRLDFSDILFVVCNGEVMGRIRPFISRGA